MADLQLALRAAGALQILREIENNNRPAPRPALKDYQNPFEALNDTDFKKRFRLYKNTTIYVIDMLRVDLERPTARSNAIPVYLQVLTALEFFANGAHQLLHGDNRGVSQASTSRIVRAVAIALAKRKNQFITFPRARNQQQETTQDFFQYSNFPGIIGAIDCTHIHIRSPGGNNALYFINRKTLSSINVQVTCSNNREVTNIVARWPGSTHDSRIFNNSTLKQQLEDMDDDNLWLVGDSGYACLPYLMTPLLNPVGRAQRRYNAAHKRARCIIERVFGMMKRRFPCLNMLRVRLDTVLAIIVACSVLWNISIAHNDEDFGGGPEDAGDQQPHPGANNTIAARAGHLRRQRLINEHFS